MQQAPSYGEIFSLHLKYVEYLLEKSYFVHQYAKDIHLSGVSVEDETRDFLKSVLPRRFRVTHGYIVFAESKSDEPVLSRQIDVIIVDSLVPNSLFLIDKESGAEIVPLEAVVGVFEVKRTLNRNTVRKAVCKLKCDLGSFGIDCRDERRVLPGGVYVGVGMSGGYHTNPIVGIIGLSHELGVEKTIQDGIDPVSLVFGMNGFLHALGDRMSGKFLVSGKFPTDPHYVTLDERNGKKASIVAKGIGLILTYLSMCSGKKIDAEAYFFNDHINQLGAGSS